MRHVKESSGKQPERGIGSGKAEAYDFEPREFQESSFARGERSRQPRESRSWKQPAKTTNEAPTMNSQERQKPTLKPQTPGNWGEETNLPVCAGTNPFGSWKLEFQNVQLSDSGHLEKVFKNIKGKGDYCRRCTTSVDRRVQDQHIDLRNVCVEISEGRDSYRTRLH